MKVEEHSNKDERWKWVPGFEGFYKASTFGRVKSVTRYRQYTGGPPRKVRGQIRKPVEIGLGYKVISLHKNGVEFRFLLHHIILLTFVGPQPKGMIGRHYPDHNPSNCRLENLSWATQKQNIRDAINRGTFKPKGGPAGSKSIFAKLTERQVKKIKLLKQTKSITINSLAEKFNVSRDTIRLIVIGKTWKHVT